MRLNDGLFPKDHILTNNPLYAASQKDLTKMFGSFVVRNNMFTYNISERQFKFQQVASEYFEGNYVPTRKLELVPLEESILEKGIAKEEFSFANEFDLLSVVTEKETSEAFGNAYLIVAPIGYGKSTLLHYVLYHLIAKNNIDSIIPILIGFHNYKNQFISFKEPIEYQEFVMKLICDEIMRLCVGMIDVISEEFWEFYSSRNALHDSFERNTRKIYGEKARKIILARRLFIMEHSGKFALILAEYLSTRENKSIIIALDDADPLAISHIEALLWAIEALRGVYPFTFILSIRNSTWKKLHLITNQTLIYPKINWESATTAELIRNRTEKWKSVFFRGKRVEYRGVNFIINRDNGLLASLINLLDDVDVLKFIETMSRGNIRSKFKLANWILSTGRIPERVERDAFHAAVLDREQVLHLDSYIAMSTIVTCNHETYFAEVHNRSDTPGIINLYECAGAARLPHRHFIRSMILEYLIRQCGRNSNVHLSALSDVFHDTFGNSESMDDLVTILNSSILRLIKVGLIESPDQFCPETIVELQDNIDELSITDLGKYYRSGFSSEPRYLVYVKDSIDLPESDVDGISNAVRCAEICKNMGERIAYAELHLNVKNTVALLVQLGKQESVMLKEIEDLSTRRIYKRHFGPDDHEMFTLKILNSLHKWSSDVFRHKDLQREIEAAIQIVR